MVYDCAPVPIYGTATATGVRVDEWDGDEAAVLMEAIEAREVMERAIARLAALRRTDDDIADLSAALAGMRASADDATAFGRHDFALHSALWTAAHNDPLASTVTALHDRVREMIALFTQAAMTRRSVDALVEHHAQLVAAIERQDADEAAAIIGEMMSRLRLTVAELAEPRRSRTAAGPSEDARRTT
jgi:DNA-binding FadR family transcriptional regulator